MSGPGHIEEDGIVCEVRPEGVCKVQLANGHKLWAGISGRDAGKRRFAVGDRVRVEISVYDVSRGRIVMPAAKGE
ncbi:MAG: translation initiation factor IF-1 [Verrucomicrobiota bacterium]|nr:translation initiation factor IF-1 [Verrucomicrobiota bacterium]